VLGALLLAFGILISIVGSAVLTAGLLAAGVNQLRDEDGYFATPSETFTTESYALTSPTVGRLTADRGMRELPFDVATVRLRAASETADVFVGIAPRADIERYLDDVQRTEIRTVRYFPFEIEYRDVTGSRAPALPVDQDIWVASASGPDVQELEWSIAPGDWGVVVMNADASAGVTAELQAAVRSDLIAPAATALIVTGAILLLVGIPMLVVGATVLGRATSRAHADTPQPGPAGTTVEVLRAAPAAATVAGPTLEAPVARTLPSGGRKHPAHLVGVRDEPLSRWLWLVKWLLAIPHYLILVFLWFAFVITTVIAGFAILFTGRYPHSLFTFNVGVMRWTWRVGFYAYSALGTDKYPPFTLARAQYPAEFDVPYPERLSRGLVLVKWWLLAIPHYLILGAISGPLVVWQGGWDRDMTRTGLSLVAALVLIAGFALLFTARYPGGLFDLLVGIQRWTYRVVTYATLMRDEYPPFRLDQGPLEPGDSDPGVTYAPGRKGSATVEN
jgi:hypothetical protein